ncbi:MAG TPA: hypothetical protein VFG86_02375, partial [Chloroflexota bacterium]|nr:hypothetical protein [Chloroflexota bacterium]
QLAAIEMLAVAKSVGQVARVVGVDPKTLYVWRQNRRFHDALSRRRRQLWADAAQRLRDMVHPSLDELDQQLHDTYDRARFRAALNIVRLADLRKAAAAIDADDGDPPQDE